LLLGSTLFLLDLEIVCDALDALHFARKGFGLALCSADSTTPFSETTQLVVSTSYANSTLYLPASFLFTGAVVVESPMFSPAVLPVITVATGDEYNNNEQRCGYMAKRNCLVDVYAIALPRPCVAP
jgi:hypothetical protein